MRTTYTSARANFAKLCDRVTADREIIIISRRGREDVALVAAEELESLEETAYLLRCPRNAQRLLTALNRAKGRRMKPQSVDKLRAEFGLERRK